MIDMDGEDSDTGSKSVARGDASSVFVFNYRVQI